MIRKEKNYFIISTERSSYIFRVLETGHIDHVMYGARIDDTEGLDYVSESFDLNIGTVPYYDEEHPHLFPDRILSEYPVPGSGDTRECALELDYGNGTETMTLLFRDYRIAMKRQRHLR